MAEVVEYAQIVALHAQGDLDAAERGYRELLKRDSVHVGAWHFLGVVCHQRGDHRTAIDYIVRSIDLGNRQAACFNNLGAAYLALEELGPAEEQFRRALTVNAGFVNAHTNLGLVACRRGDFVAAEASLRRALALKPSDSAAIAALGRLMLEQGQRAAAYEWLSEAVAASPNDGSLWSLLGKTLMAAGHPQQGIVALRRANRLLPNDAEAQFALGALLEQTADYDEARNCRTSALRRAPERSWWRLRHALRCPDVVLSQQEIDEYGATLNAALDEFSEICPPGQCDELVLNDIVLPFALQGYGLDERHYRKKFAAALAPCFPRYDPYRNRAGKPHLGVVLTPGHEGIFCRVALPILNRLSAEQLRITLICPEVSWNYLRTKGVGGHLEHCSIPLRPSLAAGPIRSLQCDVLYHSEIGSDSLNFALAMMRLAPVQCTAWGLQTTSGVPTIDDYLSSDLVEGPQAQEHYTERLVRLPSLLNFESRAAPRDADREKFSLSADATIYMCAQNPIKVHPALDVLFGTILRRDPRAIIVIPERLQHWHSSRLKTRLHQSNPDVAARIVFIPHVPGSDYQSLIATADVHLDTFPFGASTTTYDIFSQNRPLVTLPTPYNRGRYSLAWYEKMQFMDLVAATPDDYVDIAVKLGTDKEWREHVHRELIARTPAVFNDELVIRSYESYFIEAAARSRAV